MTRRAVTSVNDSKLTSERTAFSCSNGSSGRFVGSRPVIAGCSISKLKNELIIFFARRFVIGYWAASFYLKVCCCGRVQGVAFA